MALHEYTVLRLACNAVSIVRDGDALGHLYSPPVLGYEGSSRRERRAIARDSIIGCYAGMQAERIYDKNAKDSGGYDDRTAFELSCDYAVTPRRGSRNVDDEQNLAYLETLRTKSRKLVKRHWPVVQALAAELLKRKRLDAESLELLREKLMPTEKSMP